MTAALLAAVFFCTTVWLGIALAHAQRCYRLAEVRHSMSAMRRLEGLHVVAEAMRRAARAEALAASLEASLRVHTAASERHLRARGQPS